VVLADNFDRTNSTNLGSDWTEAAGDWSISSNALLASNSADAHMLATTADHNADCYAEIAVSNYSAVVGILLRYQDSSNYYMGRYRDATGNFEIWKCESGTFTLLGTASRSKPGNNATIRFTAEATTLAVIASGLSEYSLTDSTFTGGGKCGLRQINPAGAYPTPLDNWLSYNL
jgi:hypothetical protein